MVMGDMEMSCDLLVIGGGAAGCGAAFRAAALGRDVCMVDRNPTAGGRRIYGQTGWTRAAMTILDHHPEIRGSFNEAVSEELSQQADSLHSRMKAAGILFVQGDAHFTSATTVRVEGGEISGLRFTSCIIACGTEPISAKAKQLSKTDSSDIRHILEESGVDQSFWVVGDGPAELETATVLSRLGATVHLQMSHEFLPDMDQDLREFILPYLKQQFTTLIPGGESDIISNQAGYTVEHNGKTVCAQHLLCEQPRRGAAAHLQPEAAGLQPNPEGYLSCDAFQATPVPGIYAAGSITNPENEPVSSSLQGRMAAEVICGLPAAFEVRSIPKTIRTSPPFGWCGLTEKSALHQNIPITLLKEQDHFRLVKLLVHPETGLVLGCGLAGEGAVETVGELSLALEMGVLAEDFSLTLHPEGSLGEMIVHATSSFRPSTSE